MAQAPRDENRIPTLLGTSSSDGITPVVIWADPTTHRLLVDLPGGSGDVVGPASSTDNAVARFDSTTGKLLQNSGVTISDTNVVLVPSLTASEMLITDASKNLVSAAVATYPSLTELTYVKGLTSSAQTQITAKMTNPMTTGGDVIYGGASGVPTRLANGTVGQVLTSAGTTDAPTWEDAGGSVGPGTTNEIAYFNSTTSIASLAVATYPSLTELSYVKGVTSAIQTQLGTKAPSTAPTFATSITGSYLTASEILITNGSKEIVSAAVATYPSLTELAYVKGVTSAVQTQLTARLPLAGGTMTGAITLGENTSIALDPAGSADGKYTGTTVTGTGGATIAFGETVYLAVADSRWEKTDASAVGTAGTVMVGIAVTSSTDGGAITVLIDGIIRADAAFPTFTVGSAVYLSETAGDVTQTAPTTADAVVKVVGYALTANEMYFRASMDNITVTG